MKIDSKRQNKSQWKEAINSSLGNIPLLPFYVRRQSLFSDSRYVIADLSKLWLSCSCPLAFLFMPFDFPVHALWLSCSCPLAFLFMPFDFPVHALWLFCSCPLAFLFMPFGFPVHAIWLSCSCPLSYWLPNGFWKYLYFQYFYFQRIWLSVIPETRRLH